jgi:hypothetical protein
MFHVKPVRRPQSTGELLLKEVIEVGQTLRIHPGVGTSDTDFLNPKVENEHKSSAQEVVS